MRVVASLRGRLPVDAIRCDQLSGALAVPTQRSSGCFAIGVRDLEQHPFGAVEVIADDDEEEAIALRRRVLRTSATARRRCRRM